MSFFPHFPSLPNPSIFVFIPLMHPTKMQEAHGPVTHLVYSLEIILQWQNRRALNPSSVFVSSGPQNNVEGLLVSVSEFEPLFQVCTCTGFGLTI
jgi:hypothetical protein